MQRLADLYAAASPGPWEVDKRENCGPDGRWGVWHLSSGGQIFYVGDPYPRGDNAPYENAQLAMVLHRCGLEMHEALEAIVKRPKSIGCHYCSLRIDVRGDAQHEQWCPALKARQALASVAEALKGDGDGS